MTSPNRLRSVNIQRHRWCFDDVKDPDWLWGSAALSRWFDVYTLLVPDNEAFYIRTLRQCEEQFVVKEDKADLQNFFRQESLHGVAHRAYWPKMRELRIDYEGFLRFVNWLLYSVVEPAQSLRIRVSMVAAIEHINASLGNTVLKGDLLGSATRSVRELFYWHFIEEIEHKAVAHNALSKLFPGYFNRILGALIAFPTFYFLSFSGMIYFLAKEKKLLTLNVAKDLFEFWIRNGVLADTVRHLCRYFRVSFDPWDLDDSYLICRSEFLSINLVGQSLEAVTRNTAEGEAEDILSQRTY